MFVHRVDEGEVHSLSSSVLIESSRYQPPSLMAFWWSSCGHHFSTTCCGKGSSCGMMKKSSEHNVGFTLAVRGSQHISCLSLSVVLTSVSQLQ